MKRCSPNHNIDYRPTKKRKTDYNRPQKELFTKEEVQEIIQEYQDQIKDLEQRLHAQYLAFSQYCDDYLNRQQGDFSYIS